jgi:hypothetical protein
MIPHSPYAPTNPYAPEPTGICDRCGFLYPLAKLKEQMQWAGTAVVTTGLRVCPRDLDVLQQNGRRTIFIGPEPKALRHARPTNYPAQAGQTPQQFVLDDPVLGVLDDPDLIV